MSKTGHLQGLRYTSLTFGGAGVSAGGAYITHVKDGLGATFILQMTKGDLQKF